MSRTAGGQKKKINLKWFESFKTSNLDATDIPSPTKPLSLVLPKQLPTGTKYPESMGTNLNQGITLPLMPLPLKSPGREGVDFSALKNVISAPVSDSGTLAT